jgi:hypothetical protein
MATRIVLTHADYPAIPEAQLYARHEVPYHWIGDAAPRIIQAFEPSGDAYRPVGTLEGGRPVALPPFPDLPLDPATIWP